MIHLLAGAIQIVTTTATEIEDIQTINGNSNVYLRDGSKLLETIVGQAYALLEKADSQNSSFVFLTLYDGIDSGNLMQFLPEWENAKESYLFDSDTMKEKVSQVRLSATYKTFKTGKIIRKSIYDKKPYVPLVKNSQYQVTIPLPYGELSDNQTPQIRVYGVLTIESTRKLRPTTISLLTAFANASGNALHTFRSLRTIRVLAHATHGLANYQKEEDLFRYVLEQAEELGRVLGPPRKVFAHLAVYNASKQMLVFGDWHAAEVTGYLKEKLSKENDLPVIYLENYQIGARDRKKRPGVVGLSVLTAKTQNVPNVKAREHKTQAAYIDLHPDIKSQLAIPIKIGASVLAVLNIEHSQVGAFDSFIQQSIESFTTATATTLLTIRTRNSIVSTSLQSRNVDIASRLDEILKQVIATVNASKGGLGLLDTNHKISFTADGDISDFEILKLFALEAVHNNKVVTAIIHNVYSYDISKEPLENYSAIIAPIRLDTTVWGVLALKFSTPRLREDVDEIAIQPSNALKDTVQIFADEIAIAIRNGLLLFRQTKLRGVNDLQPNLDNNLTTAQWNWRFAQWVQKQVATVMVYRKSTKSHKSNWRNALFSSSVFVPYDFIVLDFDTANVPYVFDNRDSSDLVKNKDVSTLHALTASEIRNLGRPAIKISLYSSMPRPFLADDHETWKSLIEQIEQVYRVLQQFRVLTDSIKSFYDIDKMIAAARLDGDDTETSGSVSPRDPTLAQSYQVYVPVEAWQLILERAVQITGATRGSIFAYGDSTRLYRIANAPDFLAREGETLKPEFDIEIDKTLPVVVAVTDKCVVTRDKADSMFKDYSIAVPFIHEETGEHNRGVKRVLGVLSLRSDENGFNESEPILQGLAAQAVVALKYATQQHRYRLLRDSISKIAREKRHDGAMHILETAKNLIAPDAVDFFGTIRLVDVRDNTIKKFATFPEEEEKHIHPYIPIGAGIAGRVAYERRARIVHDFEHTNKKGEPEIGLYPEEREDAFIDLSTTGTWIGRSQISVAIRERRTLPQTYDDHDPATRQRYEYVTKGVLTVVRKNTKYAFTRQDKRLLIYLAKMIRLVWLSIEQKDWLNALASDPLVSSEETRNKDIRERPRFSKNYKWSDIDIASTVTNLMVHEKMREDGKRMAVSVAVKQKDGSIVLDNETPNDDKEEYENAITKEPERGILKWLINNSTIDGVNIPDVQDPALPMWYYPRNEEKIRDAAVNGVVYRVLDEFVDAVHHKSPKGNPIKTRTEMAAVPRNTASHETDVAINVESPTINAFDDNQYFFLKVLAQKTDNYVRVRENLDRFLTLTLVANINTHQFETLLGHLRAAIGEVEKGQATTSVLYSYADYLLKITNLSRKAAALLSDSADSSWPTRIIDAYNHADDLLRAHPSYKDITVTWDGNSETLNLSVAAHLPSIIQVLYNLLNNAVSHNLTLVRDLAISVQAYRKDDMVIISVADKGRRPRDDQKIRRQSLSDALQRNLYTAIQESRRIGLPIVKGIVEYYGGYMLQPSVDKDQTKIEIALPGVPKE